MPRTGRLEKAKLVPIWPTASDPFNKLDPEGQDHTVEVQFNPASLKQTFANQNANSGQAAGGDAQFAGRGSTKLSFELTFDATRSDGQKDVRLLTDAVAYFMRPMKDTSSSSNTGGSKTESPYKPPGCEFHWGTFRFRGTMDSLEETLDLFSEEGVPLRATLNVGLTKQDLVFERDDRAGSGGGLLGSTPGSSPLTLARAGDSLQQMAARAGVGDWKAVAQANGIENPRQLPAGAAIDLNARPRR